MGVIPNAKSLVQTEQLSTASFCRRRLAVVMVRLKMAESVREAATFVEQGHVRVGPNTVTDPAFHVTRNMEDFVTWVDTSKIKRKVGSVVLYIVLWWGSPVCFCARACLPGGGGRSRGARMDVQASFLL